MKSPNSVPRKLLALILCLAMSFSLLPTVALAGELTGEEDPPALQETGSPVKYTADLSKDGTENWDGSPSMAVTTQDGVLTMTGYGIAADQNAPKLADGVCQVTLSVAGDNLPHVSVLGRYNGGNDWVALGFDQSGSNQQVGWVVRDSSYSFQNFTHPTGEMTLRMVLEGPKMTLYVNGIKAVEKTDAGYTEAGAFGLRVSHASPRTMTVTSLQVYSLDAMPSYDTAELETLVSGTQQQELELESYTAESAAAFTAALGEAKRVLAQANMSMEQDPDIESALTAAAAELTQAAAGLVKESIGYVADFSSESTVNWTFSHPSATHTVEGGALTFTTQDFAVDANSPTWADGAYQATFQASALGDLGLMARYSDEDHWVTLGFGANNIVWANKNGTESYGIAPFDFDYGTSGDVTLRMVLQDTKMTLYLNGAKAYEDDNNATCTTPGQFGFRLVNSSKTVSVKSLQCVPLALMPSYDTAALEALVDRAEGLDSTVYTAESLAEVTAALAPAKKALADINMTFEQKSQYQAAVAAALSSLQTALDGLESSTGGRIIVTEDYAGGLGGSAWNLTPVAADGALTFAVPAQGAAINLNAEIAKVNAGAYTYRVKTDAAGGFGVAFNYAGEDDFNAVYTAGDGTYILRKWDGTTEVLAQNSLSLTPGSLHEVCVVANGFGLKLYIDSAIIAESQDTDLCKTPGGIGLYNPNNAQQSMSITYCYVYQVYEYVNDFSDPDDLGGWVFQQQSGSADTGSSADHVAVGSLNGSGELRLNLSSRVWAFAKDTPSIKNGVYECDFSTSPAGNGQGRIGFLFRSKDVKDHSGLIYDTGTTWLANTMRRGVESSSSISSSQPLTEKEKHRLRIEVDGKTVKFSLDGVQLGAGEFNIIDQAGQFGLRKWYQSGDVRIDNLHIAESYTLPTPVKEEVPVSIASQDMIVRMDKAFPRVLDYTMDGKTLRGNPNKTYGVRINGNLYYPAVTCEKTDSDALLYTLQIPFVGVTMKVRYQVVENRLEMRFAEIEESGSLRIDTVSFADDALFTTDPTDSSASMGLVYTDNSWTSVSELLYDDMEDAELGQSYQNYATLASNGLAATVNNSSLETSSRLNANVYLEGGKKVGQVGNGVLNYHTPDEKSDAYPNGRELTLPWATILVVGDYNSDGRITWQDSAAAYKNIRTQVFGVDTGDSQMKNNLVWIAYNSGSQVQEPFLKSLDMARVMHNYTGGFGQMVMHKGYQAEGHDDSHADYGGHVGVRQGGKEEFNKIIELGKDLNVKFGIHINVNEHMLDALNFSEETINKPLSANWGHWDQAYLLNQGRDILSGNRDANLDRLKEDLPDLSFVYVDIYGVDSPPGWMSDNLIRALNSRGYIVSTEFSGPMEQGAAFIHWGNDLHYPNTGNTSVMMRFFKNDSDIFISTALTMGSKMGGIATWGGSNSVKEGVEAFYNHTLITKYLQHLDLLTYKAGDRATYSEGVTVAFEQAKETHAKGDKIILTKDGAKLAEWVFDGYEETAQGMAELTGDATLLLPWFDRENGQPNEGGKLYHWNPKGGQTTWTLPGAYAGDYTGGADLYRLTNSAIVKVGTVPVSGGTVTLTAEAGVPYILYPAGHAAPQAADSFGEGGHLVNPGFDAADLSDWNVALTGDATAQVDMSRLYETYANLTGTSGTATLSQTMAGLEGGKTYTLYLFADISNASALTAQVDCGGVGFTTEAKAAKIPYYGITKYGGSNYQKVRVVFDVPAGVTTATLTLAAALQGQNGSVKLDDFRLWKNLSRSPRLTDPGYEAYVVYEDFENVEQGFGPFVGANGYPGVGWDHRVHLAEYREGSKQYTDYVVDGNFSLKINQLDKGPMVRTNPSTVSLKPNTSYQLKLEYITGADGLYTLKVRNTAGDTVLTYDFAATPLEAGKHSLASAALTREFTTGNSDDYYVEIVNNLGSPSIRPTAPEMGSNMERCFLSLDNFSILDLSAAPAKPDTAELASAITAAEGRLTSVAVSVDGADVEPANDWVTRADRDTYAAAIAAAKAALDDVHATQPSIDAALSALSAATTAFSGAKAKGTKSGSGGTIGTTTASYTLRFNTSGGSAIASVVVKEGTTIQLASYRPTKEGFKFEGWYADESLTDPVTSIRLGKDVTVYAKWAKDATPRFTDVDSADWFYDSVNYIYALGLIKGTSAETFSPEIGTTRAMIVTILYRLEKAEGAGKDAGFSDVSPTDWYADSIAWAAANKIVDGYGNGMFGPNDALTREQLVTILYNYAKLKGYDVSGADNLGGFADAGQISGYALPAMKWAVRNGLVNGTENSLIAPGAGATRAQLTVILERYIEAFRK